MQMKLDDIELVRRVDKEGLVSEIRSIRNVSVSGRRRIVELRIPGSEGNVFQDLGREPLTISVDGELIGSGAEDTLEELRSKFQMREPVAFLTDIPTIDDVSQVVVGDFRVGFVGGEASVYRYSLVLREHKPPRPKNGGSTKPPSQEESAREEVRQTSKEVLEGIR